MPIHTHLDATCYRARIDRTVDFDTLLDHLQETAGDPDLTRARSVLVDARRVDPECDSIELYELACYVAGLDMHAQRRIALVTRPEPSLVRQFEFLQLCAQHRGAHVRVFRRLDLAEDWVNDLSALTTF